MRFVTLAVALVCWLLVGPAFAAEPSSSPNSTSPNIVLILSDDQAWTDYSFMGHEVIQTPHLDRLAARSAVFRRGYTPVPLCRPSLMSMITGLYPHQHGVTGNDPTRTPGMTEAEYRELRGQLISRIDAVPTLPKLLAQRGYVSMQSGKWWEGNFRSGGFTHGMTQGFPKPGGRHGDAGLDIGRKTMQPVFDFIRQAKSDNKSFFLWYAPMLPHTPHNPPEQLLKKYLADGRPVELAKYYAMCELFDETCGQLLDCVESEGQTDNTIVMYVTDNGWIQATPELKLTKDWNHGFAPRSKQTVYEGGIRTPIMISYPGKVMPGERPDLASTLDIMPTLLSAVEMPAPEGLPGVNLWPCATMKAPLDRTFLCGESFSHDVADLKDHEVSLQYRWCIEGPWKLILSYDCPPDRYEFLHKVNERQLQLFQLESDPFETKNVAAEHPDLVAKLAARINSSWTVRKPPTGL
jgi:arylsulfatase A-like enzyme